MEASNGNLHLITSQNRQDDITPKLDLLGVPTNEEMEIAEKIVFSRRPESLRSTNDTQLHISPAGQAAADDLNLPLSNCSPGSLTFPSRLIKFGRSLAQDPRILEAIKEQGQFRAFYENQMKNRSIVDEDLEDNEAHSLFQEVDHDEDELWTHLESLDDQTELNETKDGEDEEEVFWDSSSFIKVGRALREEECKYDDNGNLETKHTEKKSGWEAVLEDHQCAICKGLIVGAMVVDCPRGHCYCGPCLTKWLQYERTCPLCTAPVKNAHPVWNMDKIIEKTVHESGICPEKIDWLERREIWKRDHQHCSEDGSTTRYEEHTPFLRQADEDEVVEEDSPTEQYFHAALTVASLLFAAVVLFRCKSIPFRCF